MPKQYMKNQAIKINKLKAAFIIVLVWVLALSAAYLVYLKIKLLIH